MTNSALPSLPRPFPLRNNGSNLNRVMCALTAKQFSEIFTQLTCITNGRVITINLEAPDSTLIFATHKT